MKNLKDKSQKEKKPSPKSICALCREPAELMNSHILPAFVFRWLKDTSATGFLRISKNPRRRVQDGIKTKLLCRRCEETFSRWEQAFSTNIFYPYIENGSLETRYGNWYLKFCVSVSWRVLTFVSQNQPIDDLSADQQSAAQAALERWSAFLLDKTPHPGPYEQHILPIGEMANSTIPNLPDTMNRYLMRAIEMDIGHGDVTAFTYAKLGHFVLFGFIVPTETKWRGTRIKVDDGVHKPSTLHLPMEIMDYMMDRARHAAKIGHSVPKHQQDKIEEKILSNPEHFVKTDTFKAMWSDGKMFGEKAMFRKHTHSDDSE